ncbi:MAG: ACT domain-containing protein [Oscillospiraceae bacterium]|jgi:hypothetical protein|nr:ACT domain-containing protein [Oscillospiraceae bacterium]
MATIKQLSIFVENKDGWLADILEIVAGAGADLRALSIADTKSFGVLHIIVDKPEAAEEALTKAGCIVRENDVLSITVADKPGAFAAALRKLADAGISVEYTYAFVGHEPGQAYVILRVDDNEKAERVLG